MNLHVVAYPELSPADHEFIQSYRRDYNSLYTIIPPHFTIVFSVPDMDTADFISEVRKQAHGVKAIPFTFRCAVINKDSFSNNYDAFLVPDEGFGRVTKLHDSLYSDKLARHHRLDVSYIPHLSIASSTDALLIKRIVDDLNKNEIAISGSITALDIVNYENRIITTIDRIDLS